MEIKGLIPEFEYKRARIKADVIDWICIAIGIACLFIVYRLVVENDQLLKQSDEWCAKYNLVSSELEQKNIEYNTLFESYQDLDSQLRLKNKVDLLTEVE